MNYTFQQQGGTKGRVTSLFSLSLLLMVVSRMNKREAMTIVTVAKEGSVGGTGSVVVVVDVAKTRVATRKEPALEGHSVQPIVKN